MTDLKDHAWAGGSTYGFPDRYPEPPPKPAAWQGWRRKRASRDSWQPVEGATAATKGGCYDLLMRLSELVAGEGTWEFVIWPAGQQPEDRH